MESIIIVFDFGDILEAENVTDLRKVCRIASKRCKHAKKYDGKIGRVVEVIKKAKA